MASGATSAAQKWSSPLLVPKIKIEASGSRMSGSMMAIIETMLSGRTRSKPRT
jgi:hypothetical protein